MINKTLFAHLALLTANLIYALNYTFAKDVMPEYIMPSGFILLRVIGALILFGALFLFFVNEKIQKKDILRFAICGVFGVAINQLLFFEGLNLTTPINASIVMTINPILVIFLSFIILNEILTLRRIAGILLGFIGAYILILKGGEFNFSSNTQLGNLFVFINATSYGLYLVIVKPLIERYNPVTVMFYVFSFGLLFVFPFGYNNLINDFKSLDIMKNYLYPVIFDATHSVQEPGGMGEKSGGKREFVSTLSKAAVAVGVAGIFIETHNDPDNAPSDCPNMLHIENLESLILKLIELDTISKK